MNPLILLGYIGVPAYLSNGMLTSAAYKDPNLKPKIGGVDARAVVGGLGVAAATFLTGPLGLLGAGAALGSLLSFDNARKTRIGLNTIAMHQAQQQAQIPMQPQGVLPGPGYNAVPPVPSAVPEEEKGFLDSLFSFREAA